MWRAGAWVGLAMLASACGSDEDALVVFAAASLADVAQAASEQMPDAPVRMAVGPTSLLSQQIEQGAPADVLLAAHPRWVDRLVASGRARAAPVRLARGQLVIVAAPPSSPARSAADALATADRIALADPGHVPAGEYAQAALAASGSWDAVQDRVVPVADVRAVLVAVQQGVADAGIVYASDALAADALGVVYRFSDEETPPIDYVGVAVSGDSDAEAWVRQLAAPEMRGVWRAHGFDPVAP